MDNTYPYYDNFRFAHLRQPSVKVVRTTLGTTQPVTLADVKDAVNAEDNTWDDFLTELIEAALRFAEDYCNMSFTGSHFIQYQSHWMRENQIWYPQLNAITSVAYIDTSNTLQTLTQDTDFNVLNAGTDKSILFFAYPQIIPYSMFRPDSVQITYTTTATAPAQLVRAIKLMVGTWFDRRANEQEAQLKSLDIGAIRLLDQIKVGAMW